MTKSKLPYNQIKEMIESGCSISEVARRLNKNVGSISNFCKRNNLVSKFDSTPKDDIPLAHIKKLYEDGMSLYKIAKQYDRPPAIIKKKLLAKYPDIHIRNMDYAKRPPLLNDASKLAAEMKVNSVRSIAKKLNVKISTVSAAAKRLGLNNLIRDQTITDKPEDIKLLYESGIGLTELANAYNTYPTTISNIIRRVGGTIREQGASPHDSKYDELNNKDWLIEQYVDNNRSMNFIALYLGTSVGNVSHAIDKHGIKKKAKRKVYAKLRRNNAKKLRVTTKWGSWNLQSQAEIDFVNSLPCNCKDVKYEPVSLESGGSQYVPDFYVDGEYIEIKPMSYSTTAGVDRQKFIKQLLIAKNNGITLKLWYKGKYREYEEVTDVDKYFALNWKLLFSDSDECFEFLQNFGFRPIEWNHDSLLHGLNSLHSIPEIKWLNASYPCANITNLIKHFCHHFWYSSHKEYMPVADAFRDGNSVVLKRSIDWLWEKNRGINIYGLCRIIQKYNKDFSNASIFKPWVAKYIYGKLLPNGGVVVDPCMGWGGRFLGTIGYDLKYIGYDLNYESIRSHTKLARFAGAASMHVPQFTQADASAIDWPDGDLLFTSPPYDDTEYYAGLDEQCKDTTPIYENIMRFQGRIALNVPKRHKDKCIEIANKAGRRLIDEYQMKTTNFMGRRESTYEPILVFK